MMKRLSLFFCLSALLCECWINVAHMQALALHAPNPPGWEEAPLAIIVNKTNPVENLTLNDLRNLWLAEQRSWPNGRRVTIVMREPGHPERLALLKIVCRMTDGDYARYFMQAQFVGDLQATPKLLTTLTGMRKFVFNVPGAIGYVRASEVDASVKVVRVEGRLPGEPGYKLKFVAAGAQG
jgi:ABC-type phosphate transport system substrate-binding protein